MSALSDSKKSCAGSAGQTLLVCASLTLNVFLAAHLTHQKSSLPSDPGPLAASLPSTDTLVSAASAKAEAATDLTSSTPPSFDWSEIEASDFRQYVANLRGVGCPEQIIRDIIMVDVNQLLAARVRAIWKPRVSEYWQKPSNEVPSPEQLKQLMALDKEKGAIGQDLLGFKPSQQALIDTLFLQIHGSEQQLLFLPPDRREAALQAVTDADFETKERKLYESDGYSQSAQQKLVDEKLKVLAKVLSPDELEEFRLRNSTSAQMLRMELEYFNCTPEEFKTLLAAREQKADRNNYSPDLLNRAAASEEVRKLFGDERAKEFERVTDLYYINSRKGAEEQGVSLDRVDQAWQITRDVRAAADLAAKDTSLSAEDRKRQVQALQQQAEASLTELLGVKASRAVRRDLRVVLGVTEANIRP